MTPSTSVYDIEYRNDNGEGWLEALTKQNGEKVRKPCDLPFLPYCYMDEGGFEAIPWSKVRASKTDYTVAVAEAPEGFERVKSPSPRAIGQLRKNLEQAENEHGVDVPRTHQADVPYARRVLIDTGMSLDAPDAEDVLYFDIEVDPSAGFPDPEDATAQVLSFAAVDGEGNEYFLTGTEREIYDELIGPASAPEARGLLGDYFFLVGWNSESFDLPYLKNRIEESDRLAGYSWPEFEVIHLDAMGLFRSFKRDQLSSYSLENVSQVELGDSKDMDETESYKNLRGWWENGSDRLREYNLQDADLTRRISEEYLLVETVARVCQSGHTRLSTITYEYKGYPKVAVGKAVDGAVLRRSRNSDHVFGNRRRYSDTGEFPGGYVFPPTPGTYEWVFVADFSSMYPSIIQALNIGENTWLDTESYAGLKGAMAARIESEYERIWDPKLMAVNTQAEKPTDYDANTKQPFIEGVNSRFDPEKEDSRARGGFVRPEYEAGILAEATSDLDDLAQEYKDRRNNAENGTREKKVAAAMYMGIKSLYNSSYGVVASPNHRYYLPGMSEHITETGQFLIRECARFVEGRSKHDPRRETRGEVIGGDTDSVFIRLEGDHDTESAVEAAREIVQDLNKHIKHLVEFSLNADPSYIELDVDYVASRFVQTDKKKAYACKKAHEDGEPTDEKKVVGLKCKKSDTLDAASDLQERLVEALLEGEPTGEIITNFKDRLMSGEMDDELVKHSSLGKRLKCVCGAESSEDCSCDKYEGRDAHVRAARMYNAAIEAGFITDSPLQYGDKVEYIKFGRGFENVIHPVYYTEGLPYHKYDERTGTLDAEPVEDRDVPPHTFNFTPEKRAYVWRNYFHKAIKQINLLPSGRKQAGFSAFA